jgi:hypothetical protein
MTGFFAGPAGAGVGPAAGRAVGCVAVSIPPFKGTPVGDTTTPPPTVVTTGVVLVVLLVVAK